MEGTQKFCKLGRQSAIGRGLRGWVSQNTVLSRGCTTTNPASHMHGHPLERAGVRILQVFETRGSRLGRDGLRCRTMWPAESAALRHD